MDLLHENLIGSSSQYFSVFIREISNANFHKIVVKGCVGVLWRTDGNLGKVEVIDGVGGDRGGDGILMPLLVRLANQNSCPDKSNGNNTKPKKFCRLCLK